MSVPPRRDTAHTVLQAGCRVFGRRPTRCHGASNASRSGASGRPSRKVSDGTKCVLPALGSAIPRERGPRGRGGRGAHRTGSWSGSGHPDVVGAHNLGVRGDGTALGLRKPARRRPDLVLRRPNLVRRSVDHRCIELDGGASRVDVRRGSVVLAESRSQHAAIDIRHRHRHRRPARRHRRWRPRSRPHPP